MTVWFRAVRACGTSGATRRVFLHHGVSLHTIRLVAVAAEAMFKTTHRSRPRRGGNPSDQVEARGWQAE
jgi:hypothetical protein